MYLQHHLPTDLCIGQACCNPDHLRITNSLLAGARVKPAAAPPGEFKTCPNVRPMTPENTVTERRNGHPKAPVPNLPAGILAEELGEETRNGDSLLGAKRST